MFILYHNYFFFNFYKAAWDQFGEIALFNKAVRSATIIAFTTCKFATMNSIIF